MALKLESPFTIRDQWAYSQVTQGIRDVLKPVSGLPPSLEVPFKHLQEDWKLPEATPPEIQKLRKVPPEGFKVCIIGAGAAGLFTGLIFEYLKSATHGAFEMKYDILEAAKPERVGGRLYTYNFTPNEPPNPKDQHDYYDVGAMRFPDNPIMERRVNEQPNGLGALTLHSTFALFEFLGIKEREIHNPSLHRQIVPLSRTTWKERRWSRGASMTLQNGANRHKFSPWTLSH